LFTCDQIIALLSVTSPLAIPRVISKLVLLLFCWAEASAYKDGNSIGLLITRSATDIIFHNRGNFELLNRSIASLILPEVGLEILIFLNQIVQITSFVCI
jgi:hypothetical protein